VELDGPVAHAEVVVTDLHSTVIARGRTGDNGVFNLATDQAHSDFNVSATGGVNKSGPVNGTLHSAVRARHPLGRFTPVNPATTLVKARMEQQSSASHDAATADVKKYLRIPRTHGLGYDLTPALFSGASFRASAEQAGGLDAYVAALAGELGTGKTRSFAVSPGAALKSGTPESDSEGSVAGAVAGGVLNGVLGQVGAMAFDSILSLATGARAPSADSQALASLLASAARQEAKLQEISSQVNALSAKLVTLTDNVLQRIEKDTYLSAEASATTPMLIFNQHVSDELRFIATLADTDGQIQKNLDEYIENTLRTTDMMAAWSLALRGGANPTGGLIIRWNRVVTAERLDIFDQTEAQRIQTHWDWYDGMQSLTLLHIMDYKRSKPEKYSTASMAFEIDALRVERQAQLALLRGHLRAKDTYPRNVNGSVVQETTVSQYHLPTNAVIDRTTGATMWLKYAIPTNLPQNTFHAFHRQSPAASVDSSYVAIMAATTASVEQDTNLKGWRFPHTTEAMWTKADVTGFARLRALGVDIPDTARIFYRDTFDERVTRAQLRNCYMNSLPNCDFDPVTPSGGDANFYRNWTALALSGMKHWAQTTCWDHPCYLPLFGAGQELSYLQYPDNLTENYDPGKPNEEGKLAQVDLSEDDTGKYWFTSRGPTRFWRDSYPTRDIVWTLYLTRSASDYFY